MAQLMQPGPRGPSLAAAALGRAVAFARAGELRRSWRAAPKGADAVEWGPQCGALRRAYRCVPVLGPGSLHRAYIAACSVLGSGSLRACIAACSVLGSGSLRAYIAACSVLGSGSLRAYIAACSVLGSGSLHRAYIAEAHRRILSLQSASRRLPAGGRPESVRVRRARNGTKGRSAAIAVPMFTLLDGGAPL